MSGPGERRAASRCEAFACSHTPHALPRRLPRPPPFRATRRIPAIAGLKPGNSDAINQYGDLLAARLEAQFLSTSTNHGVFLDSCFHHVAEWREIVIDGIDNAQALMAFYEGVGKPGQKVAWKQGKPYPCAACCSRGQ